MTITNYQVQINDAVWVDVNSQFTVNNLPDRLPDGLAITSASLFNLFNCMPGQRARTFQPEYGSLWLQFVHEPISELTAKKMKIFMVQSIARWEPRIQLDLASTSVVSDTNLPGYRVRVAFFLPNVPGLQQLQFQVQSS